MGADRTPATERTRSPRSPSQAPQSHLHERSILRRQDRRSLARSSRALRSMEDRPCEILALEQAQGVRPNSAAVRSRRRPRSSHRRFDLRQGSPALRWWKRGAQIQCIGRSRGGLTTKIHALVDGLGNPIHLHLTAGNIHDVTEAPRLLEAATDKCRYFIADKAYDSNAVIAAAQAKGLTVVIPPKSDRAGRPRQIDTHVYKERHLVENFFCRTKHFRRIATRYEKTAANFLGFALLAAIRIWMA